MTTTRRSKSSAVRACINITPMIDILLVVLIIFMIIAPHKPAKFEVKVPAKPEEHGPEAPASLLMIAVKGGTGIDQTVELNSTSMDLPALPAALKQALAERPDKTVYIKAGKGKEYRDVLSVIDAAKGAGAGPIGLQIDYLDSAGQ
jgi:biopolymer transport protein ExbD